MGNDGKQYPVKDIIRRFYGEIRTRRIQDRTRRPYQINFSFSNDPKEFNESALEVEEEIHVKRNTYVYFPLRYAKEENLYVGKVLCFVVYYIARGIRQQEYRFSPSSADDDVWCEVYAVRPDGSLIPAQARYQRLSMKLINATPNIAHVVRQKISNFDRKAFLDLKKQLWAPLLANEETEMRRKEELRQQRIDDMTYPLNYMKVHEVWNECMSRLAVDRRQDLSQALERIADEVVIDIDDGETLMDGRTGKKILKALRQHKILIRPSTPSTSE